MNEAGVNNDQLNVGSLIRVTRRQQVMLDRDLAELYGVETRRLNEQVKRNSAPIMLKQNEHTNLLSLSV